jgi:hypothetical protein
MLVVKRFNGVQAGNLRVEIEVVEKKGEIGRDFKRLRRMAKFNPTLFPQFQGFRVSGFRV